MSTHISVIIPVRNEEKHVGECIESVIAQTYPKEDMEVLLIDGRSDDKTGQIIETYIRQYPFIKMVENPHKIVPSALNIGIKASKGDIIIRMDAHTYYDKNYISKCVETLERIDADNVGGPIFTLPGDKTLIAKAIALATSHPFGVGNSKFRTSNKAQYVDTVTFGAFKREIFEKVGLFNERLIRNQDIELNSRIRKIGRKIFLNPEIKSYYYNQSNLKGLWRQNFKTGMWNIFTKAANRESLSIRHFVPLVFILSLIFSIILSLLYPIGIYLLCIICGIYFLASIFFSLKVGFGRNSKTILFLPIVFWTLHFSYGLGSLIGMLKLRQQLGKY